MNESKNLEGGWSGIGMATVGIHPTNLELDPTKIPPGGVVQNCRMAVQGPGTTMRSHLEW